MTTIIKVEHLCKHYSDHEVITDVSFEINEGETVVVIGPSGTGKSTLLRCLNLLTKPDSGSIWFEGQEITAHGVNHDKVRQHIGVVFQDFLLFNHLTALGNVMIGLTKVKGLAKEKAREKAIQELEYVGLQDFADRYPGQLSGGQKQRVAIARAISMQPRLLLADEPTGNLDTHSGDQILDMLGELNQKGITLAVVTHDPEVARRADRVLEMRDGEIVRRISAAEVSDANPIFDRGRGGNRP